MLKIPLEWKSCIHSNSGDASSRIPSSSRPRSFTIVIGLISRPNTSIAMPREYRCKGQSPPDKTTELPRSQSMNDNNKAYLYEFRCLFWVKFHVIG